MKELFEMMQAMQGANNPKLLRTVLGSILLRDLYHSKLRQNLSASKIYDEELKEIDDLLNRFTNIVIKEKA